VKEFEFINGAPTKYEIAADEEARAQLLHQE